MDTILKGYEVNEATWFYLSLLLIVAVFFRFRRLWSLRNVDLLLLLSMSPGLLLLNMTRGLPMTSPDEVLQVEKLRSLGYGWLFVTTGLCLVRLFFDAWFRRRPLIEQNLNAAGLTFLCVAAFVFQVTRVATEAPAATTVAAVRQAEDLLRREDTNTNTGTTTGPAQRLLSTTGVAAARMVAEPSVAELVAARVMACLSHLAVVLGLVFLGRRHLGDIRLGVAMATMYLLLPCTAYHVNHVAHVMPAALVIWALTFYHRPMVAGGLMGLACGTVFFPAFLLPLWMVFYGRNGSIRFAVALAGVAAVLIGTFAFTATDPQSFVRQWIGSIDWSVLQFQRGQGVGFWASVDSVYRIPVMAAFLVMAICLTIFPLKKNIEHLMSHSAAIVVATQLWYPQHGGVYVLWYLPLLLAVMFRPRLTHLVPPESAPLLKAAREARSDTPSDRTLSSPGRKQLP
jgi:hypothetical protein